MLNIFFSNNSAIYEKMLKNMVHSERPQTTIYGAYALHGG